MTADSPTPAELRALRAYVEAGSARDAGALLGLSESTIKGHLRRIRLKVGAKNTLQAVLILKDQLAA